MLGFHHSGNTPDDTERLKITVTGSASSGANFLGRCVGMPSGPEALRPSSLRHTAEVVIVGGWSGGGKKSGRAVVSSG